MGGEADEVETVAAIAETIVRMANKFNVDAILSSTHTGRTYHIIKRIVDTGKPKVIAATLNPDTYRKLKSEGALVVMLPRLMNRIAQVQYAIGRAVAEGLVSKGENLVCMIGAKPGTKTDTIFIHQVTGSEPKGAELLSDPVVEAAIEIAVQLGREGVDGRPVGTSFIVGDQEKVMELSHQIGINPFRGYSLSVLDRKDWYLIKRYAVPCEGAFVVSSNGIILAADRYLRAEDFEIDIPSGLGTRHRGVARITAATKAIGVVVSEGDRKVRVFQGGRMVGTIDPLNGNWLET